VQSENPLRWTARLTLFTGPLPPLDHLLLIWCNTKPKIVILGTCQMLH
jgi:hypothetical protein